MTFLGLPGHHNQVWNRVKSNPAPNRNRNLKQKLGKPVKSCTDPGNPRKSQQFLVLLGSSQDFLRSQSHGGDSTRRVPWKGSPLDRASALAGRAERGLAQELGRKSQELLGITRNYQEILGITRNSYDSTRILLGIRVLLLFTRILLRLLFDLI